MQHTPATPIELPEETSPLMRHIGLFLGPAIFIATFFTTGPEGLQGSAWNVCGLALWMAVWWITEAMPLPVTSLLPIVLLPTTVGAPLNDTLSPYASPIIYLFLGGFLISRAMEKYSLHMRIGLGIIKMIGHGPKTILAGIMVATAFMGMWMSNTATAIMMMPMAISIAKLLSKDGDSTKNPFAKAMILGVAYACVIGGLGTFVGTPVNAILYGHIEKTYGIVLDLGEWMTFGIPLLLILLGIAWAKLHYNFGRKAKLKEDIRACVHEEFGKLGRMQTAEMLVALVFACVALTWIFKQQLMQLLGIRIDDAVVAIAGGLLLFLLPTNKSLNDYVLEWDDTKKLPWGILIFFGGSLCISDALTDAGVTQWLSGELQMLDGVSMVLLLFVIVFLIIIASELLSNVATITAFLPILTALADSMQLHPFLILIPAALAASCGFMLPGASAPNALAFATGYPKVKDMIRTGFWMDVITAAAIVVTTLTLVLWVYGIDINTVPEWAVR